MHRIVRFVWGLVLIGGCGCNGGDSPSDGAADLGGEAADDGAAETNDGGDADGDDVADPADGGADADADGDACTGSGALGDTCAGDCDCATGLRCLGLPGARTCSTPCTANATCVAGTVAGCATPFCELSLGACRCRCLGPEDCDGLQCSRNYCVECATDEHCAATACGDDTPRCRPDTASCTCGGTCGDGACDDVEAAIHACPTDCPAPCVEGESHPWSCWDGTLVPWCRCASGAWVCEADPAGACPGDTECQRGGGQCVAGAVSCDEGTILAEPLGCSGASPLCCRAETCTGPGASYYPGSGRCCPGLIALSSLAPTEGMLTGGRIACMPGCWALTCAPCGDGVCEPHLGENFCNCPRDCPAPDFTLSCEFGDSDCGMPYCRMEGGVCHRVTPRCAAGTCERVSEEFLGRACDCATRSCVVR